MASVSRPLRPRVLVVEDVGALRDGGRDDGRRQAVSPGRGTRVARPTYSDLQRWVHATYGYVPGSAWIADVKARCGLAPHRAPNRRGRRRRPCPPDLAPHLVAALRHFGFLPPDAPP